MLGRCLIERKEVIEILGSFRHVSADTNEGRERL